MFRASFTDFNRVRSVSIRGARAMQHPSWAVRAAALAFAIVIGLPLLLLFLLALLAATIVFAALWGANRVFAGLRGLLPRSDGRENVRVITRSDDPPAP